MADYNITLYSQTDTSEFRTDPCRQACCTAGHGPMCSALCLPTLEGAFAAAAGTGRPSVFRCPVGLLGFALPLRSQSGMAHYLVGSGVREKSLDLYRIEAAAKSEGFNPFALLEQLQEFPITTEKAVQDTAEKAYNLSASLFMDQDKPASLLKDQDKPNDLGNITEHLRIVTAISNDMDKMETAAETVALLCETIGMLFDVPGIIAAIPEENGNRFYFQGTWGFSLEPGFVKADTIRKFFTKGVAGQILLREESIREIFPDVRACSATCLSLAAADEFYGFIALLNMEVRPEEHLLLELLSGRAALRVAKLRQEVEQARKYELSGKLMTMMSTLALTEGKELHHLILEMASELVNASCGSLMLIDEDKETLRIESAMGITPQLARTMNLKLGHGIAGKVALSGNPLLVNDIEKDERVATQNRPRFKTKSFISVALKFKGQILGVLNLADKKDQDIFTESDLELLAPFVNHVSSIIQRNCSEQKVELLERLSITDPLTELYNRRYLEKRMEEELQRSLRNNLHLTVMLIDLDYFKTYNDICGHIAGDTALKKAAKVLRSSVREIDVVTRYGGEEFCILLPGTSKKESIFVAERIRRDIENESFAGEENLPLGRLTTSIGISAFPEDGDKATALINVSDIALYQAKSEGRNRIVIFNSSMSNFAQNIPLQNTKR